MKKTVYFDLDGVLADWVKAFEAKVGIPIAVFNEYSHEERLVVKEAHVRSDFFAALEPIEHGLKMFRMFDSLANVNVEVLSAVGDVDPHVVGNAKVAWVKEHLGDHVPVHLVHKSKDKARFAGPHAILIDDRDASLDPWVEAGGHGFKFV